MQFTLVKPTPMDWSGQRIIAGDQVAFIDKFEYTQDAIAQFVQECRQMVDSIDEGLQQQVATVEAIKEQAENLYGGLQAVESAVESAEQARDSAQQSVTAASEQADRSRNAANDSETAVQRHVDSPNPHPQYLLRSDTGGLTGKLRGTLVPINNNLFCGFDTTEPWTGIFKLGSASVSGMDCVTYLKDADVPRRVAIFTRQVFEDVEVEALIRGGAYTGYSLGTIGVGFSGVSGSEAGVHINFFNYSHRAPFAQLSLLRDGNVDTPSSGQSSLDFLDFDSTSLRYILTRIKLRVQENNIKYKVWAHGEDEPSLWSAETDYSNSSYYKPMPGGIGFAHINDVGSQLEVYWMTYKEL